jgi:hypothetical protein
MPLVDRIMSGKRLAGYGRAVIKPAGPWRVHLLYADGLPGTIDLEPLIRGWIEKFSELTSRPIPSCRTPGKHAKRPAEGLVNPAEAPLLLLARDNSPKASTFSDLRAHQMISSVTDPPSSASAVLIEINRQAFLVFQLSGATAQVLLPC